MTGGEGARAHRSDAGADAGSDAGGGAASDVDATATFRNSWYAATWWRRKER